MAAFSASLAPPRPPPLVNAAEDVRLSLTGVVVYTIGFCLWIVVFQSQRDSPGWSDMRLISPRGTPSWDKIWQTDKFETEI